jgi:hypothetical protein
MQHQYDGDVNMHPPGLRGSRGLFPRLTRKQPPAGGWGLGKNGPKRPRHPRYPRHSDLPPSSNLQHTIRFFGILHLCQKIFRLTVDTIDELLIGIGDSATVLGKNDVMIVVDFLPGKFKI